MAICIFNWSTLTSGNESFTKINSLSDVLLHLVENFTRRFTIGTLTENFIINCFYWQWLRLLPCHSQANVIFRYNKRKLYFAKCIIMKSRIYCKLAGWSIYLHVGFYLLWKNIEPTKEDLFALLRQQISWNLSFIYETVLCFTFQKYAGF